jgi:hypothetical protein
VQDNCGTTYFSIEFRGINAQGFGNYPDGFSPSNSVGAANTAPIPGCQVADDFSHAWGDPNEARLSAAVGDRWDCCQAAWEGIVDSAALKTYALCHAAAAAAARN